MPTYQYACTACGHQLEAVQSFADAPLTECPTCEGRLRKLFSSVGVVFKGSGFYRTDSRASGSGTAPAAPAAPRPPRRAARPAAAAPRRAAARPRRAPRRRPRAAALPELRPQCPFPRYSTAVRQPRPRYSRRSVPVRRALVAQPVVVAPGTLAPAPVRVLTGLVGQHGRVVLELHHPVVFATAEVSLSAHPRSIGPAAPRPTDRRRGPDRRSSAPVVLRHGRSFVRAAGQAS